MATSAMPLPVHHGDPPVVANAAIWTMTVASGVFLAARLYCRGIIHKAMWWDDYSLTAGWLFIVATSAVLAHMLALGYAKTTVTAGALNVLNIVSDNLQKLALGLTKTSFSLTLLRLFDHGWQRWLIMFVLVTTNIYMFLHVILAWTSICGGTTKNRITTSCMSPEDGAILNIVGAFYSAACDFILAMLPWALIIGLQMRMAEKIGVAVALSVGVLAGIIGIMKGKQSITILDYRSPEFLYNLWVFQVWNIAEPAATVVAASIPVLRVLVRTTHSRNASANPAHVGYLRSNQASKFPVSASSRSRCKHENNVDIDNDATSDRAIVPKGYRSETSNKAGGISHTREVFVSYSPSPRDGESESDEFEMQTGRWGRVPRLEKGAGRV